jgi:hypothetical protein
VNVTACTFYTGLRCHIHDPTLPPPRARQASGRIWSALPDAHEQTGLVPVLVADEPAEVTEGLAFDILAAAQATSPRLITWTPQTCRVAP